jgi:hypothetical protein
VIYYLEEPRNIISPQQSSKESREGEKSHGGIRTQVVPSSKNFLPHLTTSLAMWPVFWEEDLP